MHLLALLLAAFCVWGNAARGADRPALPLAPALTQAGLAAAWNGNGRDRLVLALTNPAATPATLTIPAGLIAANRAGGDRLVVLRAATVTVPARGTLEVALPVAALAAQNACAEQPYQATADTEPRLAGLLRFLATQPHAPQPTSQLAALAILENITFPQWRQFLAAQRAGAPAEQAQPTPTEVTQAIDALGLVRSLAPAQTFALATDAELKHRALRNPASRAKAMQLYGIALPTGDGAVPPDLGQLLHLKPDDNCPICRQRAGMQAPAGDF